MTLNGVLPVNKPAGLTSHDVVFKARKILSMKRIGHTGTLDPAVTGVLPICLGRATRIVEYLQDLPKQYEAELIIGMSTDTQDLSGTVLEKTETVNINADKIVQIINDFIGEIEQIPPMYSAVKVNGQRLYKLAREGIEVERQPRKVQIHNIEILTIDLSETYPKVKIRVLCSKGTYIRTLCYDVGRALGYPSVMVSLIRTLSGNITLDKCLTLQNIEDAYIKGNIDQFLIPVDQALKHLPAFIVPQLTAKQAAQGQTFTADLLSSFCNAQQSAQVFRLYDDCQRFVGLFKIEENQVVPLKIFASLND